MNKLILLFRFVFVSFLFSQSHQDDIVSFTLSNQKSIKLDSTLYHYFDSTLSRARAVNDTFKNIHTLHAYVFDELILQTKASWRQNWHDGEIKTGQNEIDSLGALYGLESVEGDQLDIFILKFNLPLKIDLLEKEYEKADSILWAEPNSQIGDGDDIRYLQKRDTILYVFERGWGDCPAGCIQRYYWYILLSKSDAKLIGEAYKWEPEARFYPWNYPATYPTTHFKTAQSIIDSINYSKLWWIKRHAIEISWRFYKYDEPWNSVDDLKLWLNLKKTLISKTNQLLNALASAKQYNDNDVVVSAEYAHNYILTTDIVDQEKRLSEFSLCQNHPNPFNPTTTIKYSLPEISQVSLIIYDALGREVQKLVNKQQSPGKHSIEFKAANLSSGVYYYRLLAESKAYPEQRFEKTHKMLLLK